MIDFSLVNALSIPEGAVVKITSGDTVLWTLPVSYTNQVPISIDTDGSVYNGTGYKNGYRLSSSGAEKAADVYCSVTGYIPATGGDVIRIGGVSWYVDNNAANYLCAYDSSFNYIGAIYGQHGGYYGTKIHSAYDISHSLSTITLANNVSIAYIRVNCRDNSNSAGVDGADMIVTVNEEIT